MDKIKVAKELVKLAKNLIALNEEGDGSGFQFYHDQKNNEQDLKKLEQDRLDRAQKEGKKYILHHKEQHGLWRIMACKNFGVVRKGELGGLIESEKNLSHDGYCWVGGDAMVGQQAKIYDDAKVYGQAQVFGDAMVDDKAKIYGKAKIFDNAQVHDKAQVFGDAQVSYNAVICGTAKVDYDVEDKEITK